MHASAAISAHRVRLFALATADNDLNIITADNAETSTSA